MAPNSRQTVENRVKTVSMIISYYLDIYVGIFKLPKVVFL